MPPITRLDMVLANTRGIGTAWVLGWLVTLPLVGGGSITTALACVAVTVAVWGRHAQHKIGARIDAIHASARERKRGPDGQLRVTEDEAQELRLLGADPPLVIQEDEE